MSTSQKKFAKSYTRRPRIAARSRQNDERNSNAKSAQPAGSLVEIIPGISVCGGHFSVPFTSIHGWEELSGGANSKNQATDLLPITQVICYKSDTETKYHPLVKREFIDARVKGGSIHAYCCVCNYEFSSINSFKTTTGSGLSSIRRPGTGFIWSP